MSDTIRFDTDGETFDVADVTGYVDTLRVCVDCYYTVHGVDNDEPDYRWKGMDPFYARLLVVDAYTWRDERTGEPMAEPSFGSGPCGTCGTTVGGDRFTMDVLEK
jgi:hypothetical protein